MTNACVPGAVEPLDDDEAAQEVAEKNLAKDLLECLESSWRENPQRIVSIPGILPSSVVARALSMYRATHFFCVFRFDIDEHQLTVSLESPKG